MTLHPEELRTLNPEKRSLENKAEFTGYYIDTGLCGAICNPEDEATDWWVDGRNIRGADDPNVLAYTIDEQCRICFQNELTEFHVKDNKIYGPSKTSKKLPWMK